MDINKKLDKYLKDNLKEEKPKFRKISKFKEMVFDRNYSCDACECEDEEIEEKFMGRACYSMASASTVDNFINKELNENKFQKLLFNFIDRKGLKDSDVYNKAGIDRRLFSKIRSDENYHPSKETVISLASSLELSIDELEEFLSSASYSLPKNNKFDLIIRFCFLEKIYNIFDINDLLDRHECSLLTK